MTEMIVNPKMFVNLFYNICFLRVGFNVGYLANVRITCPELTETYILYRTGKTMKQLRETFK